MDDDEMLCPLDGRIMERSMFEGAIVDKCPNCGGSWFDVGEVARATGDEDVDGWARSAFRFARASNFGCPRCGGTCVQSHVGLVTLDTCRSCHGVWMDGGEMEDALRQASLDRAIGRAKPNLADLLRTP